MPWVTYHAKHVSSIGRECKADYSPAKSFYDVKNLSGLIYIAINDSYNIYQFLCYNKHDMGGIFLKKSYTFIIIGFLFTFIHVKVNGFDVIHDSIGYLLIVLGVISGEKERPVQEFIQAKYLGIALGIYALIHPFLFNSAFLSSSRTGAFLTLIASLTSIYLYYSLLKAEYIWQPSPQTRQYVDTYLLLATLCFVTTCLAYFSPLFGFITAFIGLFQSIYLLYALIKLHAQYKD